VVGWIPESAFEPKKVPGRSAMPRTRAGCPMLMEARRKGLRGRKEAEAYQGSTRLRPWTAQRRPRSHFDAANACLVPCPRSILLRANEQVASLTWHGRFRQACCGVWDVHQSTQPNPSYGILGQASCQLHGLAPCDGSSEVFGRLGPALRCCRASRAVRQKTYIQASGGARRADSRS